MEAKKEAFIEAMIRTYGNISASAQVVGIHRSTYYEWLKTDAEFADVINNGEYEERMKDFIELQLMKQAAKNNTAVLIFMAKTRLKDRGYVERQEVTGAGGGPVSTENKTIVKLSNGTEIEL